MTSTYAPVVISQYELTQEGDETVVYHSAWLTWRQLNDLYGHLERLGFTLPNDDSPASFTLSAAGEKLERVVVTGGLV